MYGQVAQFLPQRKEPEGSWGLAELEESPEACTPLYGLYRFVRLESMVMVLIFSRLGHKKGINFI